MSRLCVFAGSAEGPKGHLDAARVLGEQLAARGHGLVYGGACVGLMGKVADGALAEGAEVIGVVPRGLWSERLNHAGLTELIVVDTIHQRKARMAELSDAFAALPGGLGTLEEFFEILAWQRLGLHDKPIGLLDVAGFFNPLTALLDNARASQYLDAERLDDVVVRCADPALLLDGLGLRSAVVSEACEVAT